MSIVEITDDTAWDTHVQENDGHPLQLSGWGNVKAVHGWQAHRLQLDGESWHGAQVLLRNLPGPLHSIAFVPRGGVGNWTASDYDELADYIASTFHSVCLTIEPDVTTIDLSKRWRKAPNHIFIPRTLILDLTKTEDELLADINAKRRYDIRKSTKRVDRFDEITTDKDFRVCLELYHQTAARAGFPLHDDTYYHDIFKLCGTQSRIMAAWDENGALLAFTWFVVSDTTAFELYSGISDAGQHMRANYGLKWWCITEMKRAGIERYDFNGLLNDGISTFKKSFGTTETLLVGSFDAPLSPLYAVYARLLPAGKKLNRALHSVLGR